jgi:septal ring factor EnvC (AmiA/AmiB activator)
LDGLATANPPTTTSSTNSCPGFREEPIFQEHHSMKARLTLALVLAIAASRAWAQAPVEERPITPDAVENAQQKTEFAWKRMQESDDAVKNAEQALTQASAARKEADRRAQEAARAEDDAKKRLDDAKAQQAASRAQWEKSSSQLGSAWKGKTKP